MKMNRQKSRLTSKASGLPASLPLPEPLPTQPPPSQLPATPLAHLTSLCLPVRQGLGRVEASRTIQASYRGLHARRRVEKLKKQTTSGETAAASAAAQAGPRRHKSRAAKVEDFVDSFDGKVAGVDSPRGSPAGPSSEVTQET